MTNSNKKQILVIDDEADLRELLVITLGRMQLEATAVGTLADAKKELANNTFDLCLTDMNLPDGNGLELVELITSKNDGPPVAVITAYGSVEAATDALKRGAFDFISKPLAIKRLRQLVNDGLGISAQSNTPATVTKSHDLIGVSASMDKLRQQIFKLAKSQAPIYISGESGSGKEKVARLIHGEGARHDKPFVAINCGAIPTELMESEFFGHKKGSFTGAVADRDGLFLQADGGTLFLDEVADLPLHMQVKLLRVVQEKTVRPIGDTQEYNINVRFLCATHKNLTDEVAAGRFRQDLYYRLNVIESHVPPLRDRPEDIAPLIDFILERLCHNWQIDAPKLGKDVLPVLQTYPFPGNVRELENILERALTLADDDVIHAEHFQLSPTTSPLQPVQEGRPVQQPLEEYLESIEKGELLKALEATQWNRTAAAKKLGMTFRSLRYRLKKLRIDNKSEQETE